MSLDINVIRRQFPFLASGTASAYLDSAATTQKPQAVIDAMSSAMSHPLGNVHRGVHRETDIATERYEAARAAVARFIGAAHADEIIFTKNGTEAINVAAYGWARQHLKAGDRIALSILEHHSNIIPWLQLKEQIGIEIDWIGLKELDTFELDSRTRLFCITGQSNVLGIRPDLQKWIDAAHTIGAKTLVDAAQLVAHMPIDVQTTDCDFLAFSGHKIYGPTGIGVLYVKRETMKNMQPFFGGGGMVQTVTTDSFIPAGLPHRFEAGTPPIIEAIGLHAAIDWQSQFSWIDREKHDQDLMKIAVDALSDIPRMRILTANRLPLTAPISFTIDGVHPHDLTDLLGQRGFALRGGNHCAQPLHNALGINASTRMSFGLYTTAEEIHACIAAISEIISMLTTNR